MDQLKCFTKRNLDFFTSIEWPSNSYIINTIMLCWTMAKATLVAVVVFVGWSWTCPLNWHETLYYLLYYYSCFLHNNPNYVLHFHSRISCVEEVSVRNLCNPTSVCLAKEVPSNKNGTFSLIPEPHSAPGDPLQLAVHLPEREQQQRHCERLNHMEL